MPYLSISSRPLAIAASLLLAAIPVSLVPGPVLAGADFSMLDIPAGAEHIDHFEPVDLQLEVYINGTSTKLVAAVRQEQDGSLTIAPEQLYNVGIIPAAQARRSDGRIDITRLPAITARIDAATQSLYLGAPDDGRVPHEISARRRSDPLDTSDPRNRVQTGFGALLNYDVSASGLYRLERHGFTNNGLSGTFDGRMFSSIGVLDNSVSLSGGAVRRLGTSWSSSDPSALRTVRIGDLITGGLSWTRPSRLGGIQMQSNFDLRPGLVTMPVPGFSSSAAVPSTVDVFLDNSRRLSQAVPAGPFEIVDMPIVTGGGTARIVVRDENGNETVTESDYFVSDRLLRPELLDYSFELGVPRTGFGTSDDRYASRLFGTASIRYGISDTLTLEGHAEGGEDLLNGGIGVVTGLGHWGVGSLALAGSSATGEKGFQLSGALDTEFGSVRLQGRIQKAFGSYNDIASVSASETDRDFDALWEGVPRTLGQVSVSMPVLDMSYLNVSYTHLERDFGDTSRLLSASYSRPMFGGTFTASGFTDLDTDNYGLFASFSVPLGGGMTASSTASVSGDDVGYGATLTQSPTSENDNVGWQLAYQQADDPRFAARGDVKTGIGEFGGNLRHSDDATWASGRARGAVVAAGGGLFLADHIDDSFGIVDAGAPDVTVMRENRPIGKTGRNGMVIVPDLRSYQRNTLGIDPNDLPIDAAVENTRQTVVPADRTGVKVSFGTQARGGTAIVELKDSAGSHVEVGSEGRLESGETFLVGYDGEAFVTGLQAHNRITVTRADGKLCSAQFDYARNVGSQVRISNVICTAK